MEITRSEAACLIAGPAGFAASTFLWTADGRYGASGGAVVAVAVTVWAFGLIGLYRTLGGRWAAPGTFLTLLGMLGGAAFGFQGFFGEVYHLDAATELAALDAYPLESALLLWIPGPLFPAALVVLGVGLLRARVLAGGALVAAGLLFPVSRIPRETWVAHLVDLLLLVTCGWLALRRGRPAPPAPAGDRPEPGAGRVW